jgi:hypothetical protein
MKRSFLKSFFIILALLMLTFSAWGVTTAYADDATPPPANEEPVAPPVDESGTDGSSDENAVIADETIVEDVAAAEDVVTEDVVVEEATSVESEECIPQPVDGEALPEGSEAGIPCVTEERIIGENGIDTPVTSGGESLASATEAETLFSGDPMWCPAGVMPGSPGCTASFASFNGFGGLINALETGSYAGAGTIYIAWDYSVSESIRLDSKKNNLTDLVFQGGWDFMFNKVVGETTFRSEINFYDWGGYGESGSLTINDINVNGLAGDGLYIGDLNDTTTANVILNNVSVSNQDSGAFIKTTGAVTINNSEFINNVGDGLDIFADGSITLNNVTASNNTYDGVYITGDNNAYAGSVNVNGGAFTNNGNGTYNSAYGLNIYACQLSLNGAQSFGGNQSGDSFFGQNPDCANSGEDTGEKKKPKTSTTSSSSALCAVSELTAGEVKGLLNNLCGINVLMSEILEEDLPAELSDEMTFHLGVKISAIGLPVGGYIELSFPIPEGIDAANLVVLFWNETEWVETPGGEVVNGFLVIKVSEPGIYVLSSK